MRVVFFVITILIAATVSASELSVREELPGNWDWTTEDHCKDGGQEYSFSEDGAKLYVTSPVPLRLEENGPEMETVEYRILRENQRILRMKILGETRMTDEGEPVVWDLVLKDENTFCWHRTDWPATGCTKDLKKCD